MARRTQAVGKQQKINSRGKRTHARAQARRSKRSLLSRLKFW